jgi:hypothetical protein
VEQAVVPSGEAHFWTRQHGSVACGYTRRATDKGRWPASAGATMELPWCVQVPVSYVDRSRPKGLTVLGHNLVVWHHAPTNTWQCFEDKCPHRLAPLSGVRAL